MAPNGTYAIALLTLLEQKHMIATAATNSAVVIWDLTRKGQKQGKEEPHCHVA
jgi:hypothetical protein